MKERERQPDADAEREGERLEDGVREEEAGREAVAALRMTLRSQTISARKRAAAEALVERLSRSLLSACERLVRTSAPLRHLDPEDIAQAAWVKTLRYLAEAHGDRVETEIHLKRILRQVARQILLDALEREARAPILPSKVVRDDGTDGGDTLDNRADESSAPDALLFGLDDDFSELIAALFAGDDAFRERCRMRPRRRPEVYRAYTVCQLALFLRREAVSGFGADAMLEPGFAATMRDYAGRFGVAPSLWAKMEAACLHEAETRSEGQGTEEETCTAILDAVNAEYHTNLKPGTLMAVLRYELNRFARGTKGEKDGEISRAVAGNPEVK